jgi:hypothetical protein
MGIQGNGIKGVGMANKERRGGSGGNYVGSLTRVKRFIDRMGGKRPSEAELARVVPDLKTLFDKFTKIRQACPASMGMDLSEDLWALLDQAGIARREIHPLRKAAGS